MAAFIAFAVGCSAAPGSEVQIAEGSAEFSQGDLVVKLDANPTTGYEWTFQIDGSAVQPDGDEFVPASDGAQPKTGEGGVHTFNFKADGSGEDVHVCAVVGGVGQRQDRRAACDG